MNRYVKFIKIIISVFLFISLNACISDRKTTVPLETNPVSESTAPSLSEEPAAPELIIKEQLTKIGALENGTIIFTSTIATNFPISDNIAFAVKYEKDNKTGLRIFRNGQFGPVYDTISKLGLIYSPDGKRLAYISRTGNNVYAVIDGKQIGPYESIANLVFSPDSAKVAYLARDFNKKYFVVENGNKSPEYIGISWSGYPLYSLDSSQMVYPSFKNESWVLVLNGKELEPVEQIKMALFSPDSKHFCYVAKHKNSDTWFINIDGKQGEPYEDILFFLYSPDSQHTIFIAKSGDDFFVVYDGVPQEKYKIIDRPVFSSDSKRYMYSVNTGKKGRIIVNDEPGPWVKGIGPYGFSLDSAHYVYVANEGKMSYVYTDGKKGNGYETVSIPVFSPDSQRVSYLVKKDDKQCLVVNNKESNSYDSISWMGFTSDGQHLSYIAKKGEKYILVLDGDEIASHDEISMAGFTNDNKHLVYQACDNNEWYIVVDGQKGKERYKGFVKNVPIKFTSPTTFHVLALKASDGPEFYRVNVEISDVK